MSEFLMPTLGADMTEGTLVEWRKKPGDPVKRGEIIAEVDTEKAAIEVEAFTSGILEKILVQPGDKVPVGTVMAIIKEEGKPGGAVEIERAAPSGRAVGGRPEKPLPTAPSTGSAGRKASGVSHPSPPRAESERLRISPAARKLAAELRVEFRTLKGTGPEAAITLEDVQRAARSSGAPTTGPEAAADRQARMRQTIAAAMARSKREIPHYYLSTTIDMSRASAWLTDENRRRPVTERLLQGILFIKAVALALREVPELNAVWKDGQLVQSPTVNVGVAISLRQGGLVAPAIHQSDRKSLGDLMGDFRDLVKRARAGSLRSSELSDPTITVTSLGEQGVEAVFGVIYPPQVALVGFGKVVERPWVHGGKVVPRPTVTASLSADHRVSDGHRGAIFLAAIDRLLQEPGKL